MDPFLTTSSVFMMTADRDPTANEPSINPQLFESRLFMVWRNTVSFDLFYLKSASDLTVNAVLTWTKFNGTDLIPQ